MITQKNICLKLNKVLLQELDREVAISAINRNKLINYAIYHYLRDIDNQRQLKCNLISKQTYLDRCLITPKF